MAKITFTVETDALIRSLHVARDNQSAVRVPLIEDENGVSEGSIEVDPGSFTYMLVLRAGAPESEYLLTLQRDELEPVPRPGRLDGDGNGGEVGFLSF